MQDGLPSEERLLMQREQAQSASIALEAAKLGEQPYRPKRGFGVWL